MLPRERVSAAIEFRPPDAIPVRIFAAAGGLYEHGQKLADILSACGHDFGDLSHLALPPPPSPQDFDPDGRYHAIRTDAWGTTWEYRIYGIWGHPIAWPLADLGKLEAYQPPPPATAAGPDVDAAREQVARQQERYFVLGHGGSIFEPLHSLRRFEDVLIDIADDTPEIHRIADMLTEHALANVRRSLATGVDGVAFGDDYGTQEAPILSPAAWHRFFKPRYERLFAPIRAAGKRIFFHTCGQVWPLLPALKEMGVDVIWPQITAFDVPALARRCRELRLCVELHPDRGELMQRGTPAAVRRHVHELVKEFGTAFGGSWLYLEIDPGFPWENVVALVDVVRELSSRR
jgi:uroporphyrinogen-III decarboxylase